MSMKDTDVRIGNWVDYGHGRAPVQITGKDLAEGIEDRPFRGIPLSPEWLERLGFEPQPNGIWYLLRWENHSTKGQLGVICFTKNGDNVGGTIQIGNDVSTQAMKGCKFVHQLQNLYFALTGQELTLKP